MKLAAAALLAGVCTAAAFVAVALAYAPVENVEQNTTDKVLEAVQLVLAVGAAFVGAATVRTVAADRGELTRRCGALAFLLLAGWILLVASAGTETFT
jgi:hypothetical protein